MTTETPRTIYAPENLARDVTRLAESISGKGFEGIFPLNRGGHIIAGYLSGKTGLPVNTCGCHMNSSDLYVADSIRTKEELEQLRKDTIQLIKTIEKCREFNTKKSQLCDWCEYRNICTGWKC